MRRYLFGAASLVALSASWTASAQTGGTAAAQGASQVEELVVTGEKAVRSLQDTVASVAVVSARRIDDEKIQTFFDLVDRTANVSQTYGASGFTIRGISNTNVSGGGSGGLASVYVDGAPIPERQLHATPLDLWDVAQVEVLRGPQSTLQGRNALAGAVVIRTQDPTFDWTARARSLLSDRSERSLAVAFGGPIVADQLAFRVALEDRKAEGFIENVTRGEDEDDSQSTTARVKLLLTPTFLPRLRTRAVWTHDERDGGYIFTYARTDTPDPFDDRVSTGDSPNTSDSRSDIVAVETDYDLGRGFTLTAASAYSRVKSSSAYDGDAGPQNLSFGGQDDLDRTFTQELRLGFEGERLSGLVGAYYAKRERDTSGASLTNVVTPRDTLVGVLTSPLFGLNAATARAAADLYVAALPVIPVDYAVSTPETITTTAIFGDGRFRLTPKLSLLGGFRYDREENKQSNVQTADFAGAYPNPAAYGAFAPVVGGLNQVVAAFVAQASSSAPLTQRKFEAFLPKAGLKYDATENLSLSFMVQRGYRSGGATVNPARSAVVAYDPEYTWNYEASLRSTWLDGALILNANAYYVKWREQQVTVNLGLNTFDYQTENAGRSHLSGFEVEAQYRPGGPFDAYATLGHSRTKFDEFQVSTGGASLDLSGSEFAYAPHWTMAVGANYRWDNGLSLNVNANYRSDAFGEAGADQAINAVDARTVVNAKLSYARGPWEVSLFGRNLFDEEYVQYSQATLNRAMFGDPRVVGVILEARW